jgi:hypothetical protein
VTSDYAILHPKELDMSATSASLLDRLHANTYPAAWKQRGWLILSKLGRLWLCAIAIAKPQAAGWVNS